MSTVVFYEKPGCTNNTRQKVLLASAGHTVLAKNLLTEQWTPLRLRPFFGDLPVSQWFNPSAPSVKSGEVTPERMSEDDALLLMVKEPLLIRRPLMEANGECRAGFDQTVVDAWIGLGMKSAREDMKTCPRGHADTSCMEPAES